MLAGAPRRVGGEERHVFGNRLLNARRLDRQGSIAKLVSAQEILIDRDGRLRSLSDGHCDKEDIARNVTCHIYPRNTAFFRDRIDHNATLVIPLAAEIFREV